MAKYRLGVTGLCLLVATSCTSTKEAAKVAFDQEMISESKAMVVFVLDTPATVEFPGDSSRYFVTKIPKPSRHVELGLGLGKHDYLVTGIVDVQNALGNMQRRHWWVVRRLHEHGGYTNEAWGFGRPPRTQEEIDAQVNNWGNR